MLRGFTLGYHLSTAKEDLAGAPAILTFEARHTADSEPVLVHGYYRNENGNNLGFSYPINNKMTTTDWQRFVIPIDPDAIPDTMDGVNDFYLRKDGSDNNVDIQKVKLEIGNISTSFTLAPEDWQSQIDEKASQGQVSDLEQAQSAVQSLLEQYPSADSLNNLSGQYSDLDAYTKVLQDAIDSNKTDVLDRFKILEANVGSGQAFMQAVSRYLSFGEEGLVLGQEGNALKVAINNEKISFLDSGKEVAYVSGQMLYILSGVFLNTLTIGNHKIEKLADSNKITTISWIGGN
ncbi:MAG: hypothetical protein PT939_06590 [Aerococcus suis]|nr:hypothetical protein [Aerococcus suis]